MASSCYPKIRALFDKPLPQLMTALKNSENSLRQTASEPDGTTALIDLSMAFEHPGHSLAIAYILNVAAQSSQSPELLVAISSTIVNGDAAQLQQDPIETVLLAGHLRDIVVAIDQPRRGIIPLQRGVMKVTGGRPLITPIHAMLFQCCLLAGNPAAAVPTLELDAFDVDPTLTGMMVQDFLLYCYYGGLIHCARKRYAKAAEMLLGALTAPSVVSNAIVVAAWKKWVLVGLLTQGNIPALPKWTSPAVIRALRNEGTAYYELAAVYDGKSAEAMNQTVMKHGHVFEKDANMGLVMLVVEAQTMRNVLRLTQTFVTLSLSDIAIQVGLPHAEAAELAILRMVDAGEIFAVIDGGKGMVRFLEDPQQFNSAATVAKLDAHIASAAALGERLTATCAEVSRSTPYLAKVHHKGDPRYGNFASNTGDDNDVYTIADSMMPPEPSLSGSTMQS